MSSVTNREEYVMPSRKLVESLFNSLRDGQELFLVTSKKEVIEITLGCKIPKDVTIVSAETINVKDRLINLSCSDYIQVLPEAEEKIWNLCSNDIQF